MKKTIKGLFFSSVFFVLLLFPIVATAETLTLTTYYPSPFGAYDQIRLVPRAPQAGACAPGTIYVRSDNGLIDFCTSGGTWGPPPGVWLQTGTNIYPADLTANVGIGTSTSTSKLEVRAVNGSIAIGGTLGAPDNTGLQFLDYGTQHAGLRWSGDGSRNLVLEDASISTNPSTWYGASPVNFIVRNGSVGIGMNSPSVNLHIGADNTNGRLYLAGSNSGGTPMTVARPTSDNAQVMLGRSVTSDGGGIELLLSPAGSGYGWKINAPDADARQDLRIFNRQNSATWSEKFTIQGSTGNVGIGVATPTQKLDVNGQIKVNTANVGFLKVLTDIDGAGTADWRFPAYAP